MNHCGTQEAIDLFFQVYHHFTEHSPSQRAVTKKNLSIILSCLLFLFEDSEDVVDQKIDRFILDLLDNKSRLEDKASL